MGGTLQFTDHAKIRVYKWRGDAEMRLECQKYLFPSLYFDLTTKLSLCQYHVHVCEFMKLSNLVDDDLNQEVEEAFMKIS